MRIAVDSGGYVSAVDDFYEANHGVVDAVEKLSGTLGSSGAMTGDDTGRQTWAEQYDAAAAPLLQAGCQVGEAMAQMANLLNASLSNHEGADYGSRVYGPPIGGAAPDDPDPDHWTETLSAPRPAAAYGGTGDQPDRWHWIAGHVGGPLWPDADTGQLRSTGDAWKTAGQQVSLFGAHVQSAGGQINLQKPPEVPDAVATCRDLQRQMGDLSDAYTEIGQACADYAQQVDDHHRRSRRSTRASSSGRSASRWAGLIELAQLAAVRIGALVAKVGRVTEGLKNLLAARAVREKVAPTLVKDSRSTLLRELEQQGVKHNPAEVVGRVTPGAVWPTSSASTDRSSPRRASPRSRSPTCSRRALEKGTVIGQ